MIKENIKVLMGHEMKIILVTPSAPEAGKLLKDPREHCFVNEIFQKHSKNNGTSQIFSLGIGITKVLCIAMVSIRSVEQ